MLVDGMLVSVGYLFIFKVIPLFYNKMPSIQMFSR